jgi:hypothetical protein
MKSRRLFRRKIWGKVVFVFVFLFVFTFNKELVLNYVFFTGSNAWFFEGIVLNIIIDDLNKTAKGDSEDTSGTLKEYPIVLKSEKVSKKIDDNEAVDAVDTEFREIDRRIVYVKNKRDNDPSQKRVSIKNVDRNMLYPSVVTLEVDAENDKEGKPTTREITYLVDSDIFHNYIVRKRQR